MATLTLIDGSGFVFRAYHAIPPLSTSRGEPTNAVLGFATMLLRALREAGSSHAAVVFDVSRRSFRTELDPAYKAQRPAPPADLVPQFPLVREVARALSVPVFEREGFEADDVIATLATRARAQGLEVVIVTGDKDFAQLVGEHVRLFDPMREAQGKGGWTGPAEVAERFGVPPSQAVEYQALLGDTADNVPGVPGVGAVTAAALVRHFGSVEAMLANPAEIPAAVKRGGERLRERVVEAAERIRLNRRLVALRTDLDLPFDAEALRRQPPDPVRARELFARLEFSRLLRELPAATEEGDAAGGGARAAVVAAGGDPPGGERSRPAVAPPARVELVLDAPGLAAAVERLRGRPLGLVVVGTGDAPRTDPPIGLALAGGEAAFYLPLGHRYLGSPPPVPAEPLRALLGPLLAGGAPIHVHGRKDALHRLARLGLELGEAGEDTELLSRLLLPTRREHAVDSVARERLGVELPAEPWAVARRPAPLREGMEAERVAAWAGAVAAALPALAEALLAGAEAAGLGALHREIERPLVRVLYGMEQIGVAVDRGAMDGMSAEFGAALEALQRRIEAAAGHPFNVASTRELGRVLFEELGLPVLKRLKTGPSTDVEVLERLAEQHPLPGLVLEHRSLSKLKGTYVDALPRLVDPVDGRLHTTFHQAGAATGRLSSSDPNLQNIPVRTELSRRIRAAFVAPPGRRLISADYSQIELRILAHYSGDPALIEAFRTGQDVHARTAAETFGVAPEAVSADQRRIAKVLNFGIAYGLSAFGLGQRLDLAPAEARAIIDRYFARYAGVKRWLGEIVERARRDGEVRTLFGRVREIPDLAARNQALRQAAERTAVNTPIQGTAADIVKIAMRRVAEGLAAEGLDARLTLQVHDELVVEAAEGAVEAAARVLRRDMEGVAAIDVPLVVEVGHGRSWAEAH